MNLNYDISVTPVWKLFLFLERGIHSSTVQWSSCLLTKICISSVSKTTQSPWCPGMCCFVVWRAHRDIKCLFCTQKFKGTPGCTNDIGQHAHSTTHTHTHSHTPAFFLHPTAPKDPGKAGGTDPALRATQSQSKLMIAQTFTPSIRCTSPSHTQTF